MNDFELWIDHDGPQPRIVRELLGAEDAGPEAPDDDERLERAILARIDATPHRAKYGGDEHAEPQAHEAPACPMAQPAIPQAAAPPPASLASTAMALDLPPEVWRERGKMPFVTPDQVPPQKRCARTEKVPVMPSVKSETLPLGDESIAKIVAAMPFQGANATTTVYLRDMKLETYTSIYAELWAKPHAFGTTLMRYRVPSGAALQLLHQHWWSRFAACPQEYAKFQSLLPSFKYQALQLPW